MTPDEKKSFVRDAFQAVLDCRTAQKKYWSFRNQANLKEAIRREQVVDGYILRAVSLGIVTTEAPHHSSQSNLFPQNK